MENNNTQPQAFYTKMPSDGDVGNSTTNTTNRKTPRIKKKSNIKMILGAIVLLIVLLGSGAGFYLSQQNQDLRQQASEGILPELSRCEPCVDPASGDSLSGGTCAAGLVCRPEVNEVCRGLDSVGSIPICTSVQSSRGFCLNPEERIESCFLRGGIKTPKNNCITNFSVPKGTAICENKIAQSDFTPAEGVAEVIESFQEPGSFNVGDQFVFSITVTADDNTDGDVVVTDNLPSNLKFIENANNTAGIQIGTVFPDPNRDGNKLSHQIAIINLGEMTKNQTERVEFMVEVVAIDDDTKTTTNSAKVTTNNNIATESICSYEYTTVEGAVECISKELYDGDPSDSETNLIVSGSALTRGEEYAYYITVKATNKTNGEVKVHDIIPEGLEFVRALPGYEEFIANEAGENEILANLGVLENEEATLGFVVKVSDNAAVGDIDNSALVYIYPTNSGENEPFETGSSCEVSHTIIPVGTAQCIEKEAFTDFDGNEITADTVVDPGQEFVYKISVQADDTTTGDVVLVDELSDNLIFVDDPDNTEGIEYDSDTREVSFDFGVISDTNVKTVEFKVQVIASPTGTKVDNSATITTDDDTSHVCEITLLLEEDEEEEYACNESCSTNEQCQSVNDDYVCYSSDDGDVCRLDTNLESESCSPATTPTPTPTPVVTPAPGCNELCSTNADCSNNAHVCTTTDDGSNRCRLDNYPDSETCTVPVVSTTQPELPETLPETGPEDWLNWLKAGLVTLGVGTALLLLL